MKPVACLGDVHVCPAHGVNSIVTATSGAICDGKPIAVVGDMTGCGATIVTGEVACTYNGKPVATQNSKTSHGGTITSGALSQKV